MSGTHSPEPGTAPGPHSQGTLAPAPWQTDWLSPANERTKVYSQCWWWPCWWTTLAQQWTGGGGLLRGGCSFDVVVSVLLLLLLHCCCHCFFVTFCLFFSRSFFFCCCFFSLLFSVFPISFYHCLYLFTLLSYTRKKCVCVCVCVCVGSEWGEGGKLRQTVREQTPNARMWNYYYSTK